MADVERELQMLRETVATLQAQVTVLTDRWEIFDCAHRYTKGIDRRDWELLASAYHDDAIDQHGDVIGSRDEIVEYIRNVMTEWDYSVHFLDLNNVDIDGDTAHAESYVLFTQQRIDGGGLDFGGGRYVDRLEKRNGTWGIVTRQVVIDWAARAEAVAFADVDSYRLGSWDRDDPSYQRPLTVTKR